MVKPRGAVCNLGCAYCYYLPKDALYPGSDFRLADDLLEELTRQYLAAQRGPEITLSWQGGEPLLAGLDFFRRAVALQHRYCPPGARVQNALQTNGVLLDDDWCRFFRQHDFLIGVSLDGPRPLHDAYRADKGGAATFDRVMDGVARLREHGVEFNVLTTVHAANADHPLAVYRFLRDEAAARFIQFIPIVQRENETGFQEGERVTARSVTGEQVGDFLSAVFDEWVRWDVGRVFVQIFDVALGAWLGQRSSLCVFAETCGLAVVMEHNGDVYACDHFVEPGYRLGNLRETPLADLVGSERQRRFGAAKRDTLPADCRQCAVRFACNGGCPKDRVLRAAGGEPGLNFLCAGYKSFFSHIDRPMRLMAAELRAGRPAANVSGMLLREEADLQRLLAHAQRNDPCPCGSGRKFKLCHGRELREA
jgi:uncharacterized protein